MKWEPSQLGWFSWCLNNNHVQIPPLLASLTLSCELISATCLWWRTGVMSTVCEQYISKMYNYTLPNMELLRNRIIMYSILLRIFLKWWSGLTIRGFLDFFKVKEIRFVLFICILSWLKIEREVIVCMGVLLNTGACIAECMVWDPRWIIPDPYICTEKYLNINPECTFTRISIHNSSLPKHTAIKATWTIPPEILFTAIRI